MDPAQWLAAYDQKLTRLAENAQLAEASLRQVGARAASPHGEVEVRVGPSGALEDLRLTPAARRLEADQLARLILATVAQAQRVVGAKVIGIMTEYVGEGPALDLVKENLPPAAAGDAGPGVARRGAHDPIDDREDDYLVNPPEIFA